MIISWWFCAGAEGLLNSTAAAARGVGNDAADLQAGDHERRVHYIQLFTKREQVAIMNSAVFVKPIN
jgi:hypothetical protein